MWFPTAMQHLALCAIIVWLYPAKLSNLVKSSFLGSVVLTSHTDTQLAQTSLISNMPLNNQLIKISRTDKTKLVLETLALNTNSYHFRCSGEISMQWSIQTPYLLWPCKWAHNLECTYLHWQRFHCSCHINASKEPFPWLLVWKEQFYYPTV